MYVTLNVVVHYLESDRDTGINQVAVSLYFKTQHCHKLMKYTVMALLCMPVSELKVGRGNSG